VWGRQVDEKRNLKLEKCNISRKAFLRGVAVTAVSFVLGCEREDIGKIFSEGTIPGDVYGTGVDGDITVYYDAGNTSWYPVSIKSIYEDDVVNGVITWRGTNKGLNKKNIDPADLYDPLNGRYINAENFTIEENASVSGVVYDGSNGSGIFDIRCRATLTVEANANIDMSGKGFAGGAGVMHNGNGYGPGNNGQGPGYGYGAPLPLGLAGGSGGSQYGDVTLTSSNITELIGSGGGSGSANADGPENARYALSGGGGIGGGAIRIYAVNAVVNGSILASGVTGGAGDGNFNSSAGGGGGGSGGSILFICNNSSIGSGTISVAGGPGGVGRSSYWGGAGGGGGAGFSSQGETGDPMAVSFDPNDGGDGAGGYIKMNKNFPGTTIS